MNSIFVLLALIPIAVSFWTLPVLDKGFVERMEKSSCKPTLEGKHLYESLTAKEKDEVNTTPKDDKKIFFEAYKKRQGVAKETFRKQMFDLCKMNIAARLRNSDVNCALEQGNMYLAESVIRSINVLQKAEIRALLSDTHYCMVYRDEHAADAQPGDECPPTYPINTLSALITDDEWEEMRNGSTTYSALYEKRSGAAKEEFRNAVLDNCKNSLSDTYRAEKMNCHLHAGDLKAILDLINSNDFKPNLTKQPSAYDLKKLREIAELCVQFAKKNTEDNSDA